MDYSVLQTDPVSKDPRFRRLVDNWQRLRDAYLPLREDRDEFYSYNRAFRADEPLQGWKLHVSATILSACEVFSHVAPLLARSGVRFKAITCLVTLKRLNCGSFFGYQQVGKFITVFPREEAEALSLARALHDQTKGLVGPAVPSDFPYQREGIVFYRYGAFRPQRPGSDRCDAITNTAGELVPDTREPGKAVPPWLANPFPEIPHEDQPGPLDFGLLPYQTVRQRGKGAVRRALDLRVSPARLLILKEGRRWGEIDLDGRDGYGRLEHEEQVLGRLHQLALPVPQIQRGFPAGDRYYLAMEHIDGKNLQTLLMAEEEPLPLDVALSLCFQTARFVSELNERGWAWRDCKPQNLLLTKEGLLRPIDFEDAARLDDPRALPAGTRAYLPPEWPCAEHRAAHDCFALGVTFHQLLSGMIRQSIKAPIEAYRSDVPPEVRRLMERLLSPEPRNRPRGPDVVDRLERILAHHQFDVTSAAALYEKGTVEA